MRKVFVGTLVLFSSVILASCGSTSNNSSSVTSENSSLKKEVKSLKGQIKAQSKDSDDDQESSGKENPNKTTESNAVMGKEYVLKDKEGNKLVGVTLTQADNKFTSFATDDGFIDESDFNQGKKANLVQITAKYTNYGIKDGWTPSFDVYDDSGEQAKSNDYEDGGDDVSLGHSGTISDFFILSKPYAQNHKLEIEYTDYLGENDDEVNAKWVVEQ